MCRARALARVFSDRIFLRKKEHGNGRQAHDGTVPSGLRVGRSRKWIASRLIASERCRDRVPDVEAKTVAAEIPVSPPPAVAVHLVSRVENPPFSTRLAARHSAIDVSSVHCPGSRPNGPPPTMSDSGSNCPRARNSTVVPKASPVASPSRHPENVRTGPSSRFPPRTEFEFERTDDTAFPAISR